MKRKLTVTIGIPAYNEEQAIVPLLSSLLSQSQDHIKIEKIIVASDGSTDRTRELVRAFNSPLVHLYDDTKRIGQSLRQNHIIEKTKSDVLILLNADIWVKDKHFLEKLTRPILYDHKDLVSCRTQAAPPENFFQNILAISIRMKQYMYEAYNGGENVYTCHGRVRAFSKPFYTTFRFVDIAAEDAYSYLWCISRQKTYSYVRETAIYYRLPMNIPDHEKQSVRFLQTKDALTNYFEGDFVKRQYAIPARHVMAGVTLSFIQSPILTIVYLFLYLYMNIRSKVTNYTASIWTVASSTKATKTI